MNERHDDRDLLKKVRLIIAIGERSREEIGSAIGKQRFLPEFARLSEDRKRKLADYLRFSEQDREATFEEFAHARGFEVETAERIVAWPTKMELTRLPEPPEFELLKLIWREAVVEQQLQQDVKWGEATQLAREAIDPDDLPPESRDGKRSDDEKQKARNVAQRRSRRARGETATVEREALERLCRTLRDEIATGGAHDGRGVALQVVDFFRGADWFAEILDVPADTVARLREELRQAEERRRKKSRRTDPGKR